jgi:serine/threonine-protein kinase
MYVGVPDVVDNRFGHLVSRFTQAEPQVQTPRPKEPSVSSIDRQLDQSQPPDFHGYRLTTSLGSAGMSEAYIATRVNDGQQVFLKRARINSTDKGALEREAGVYDRLLRLGSNHVPKVLDFIRDTEYVALVTEYADGGDLQTFVKSTGQGRGLTAAQAKEIGLDIAQAIKDFHDNGIVHRDLKPQNVLNFGGDWKLADFGIAKNLSRPITAQTFQQRGTLGYGAPEQFQGVAAHASADIYSFGKILVFLLTGQTDVDFLAFTAWSPLIKRCIASQPDQRPTIGEVVCEIASIPT